MAASTRVELARGDQAAGDHRHARSLDHGDGQDHRIAVTRQQRDDVIEQKVRHDRLGVSPWIVGADGYWTTALAKA